MFQSATFKLTSWYLGIIVAICILFSVVIYSIASREIASRISLVQPNFIEVRDDQVHQAEANLVLALAITNMCIWTIGGVGSYYLARRTLQPIEEAHEAQSRFVSDASHELRTPLASMKTELEVALRDPALTKAEAKELLASNLEEVDKLTQLSSTLLQLAKLDTGAITSERVPLQSTIQTAIKRFGSETKRVKMERILFPLDVTANRLQVEELATILVDNALKYSPPGSKVTITFLKEKQLAGFTVSNEGEGIPPKILPHIFDRFYQIEKSRTNQQEKGYGLGLSLAKKIVELHQGELSASSAPGATTTFTVLLPRFVYKQLLGKKAD
jgi:signal transduction histidine kinase